MFRGVHTAIITPFRQGELDLEGFEHLVRRQVEAGVDGIVPCGTTGESATLSDDEILTLIDCAVRTVAGRCAVIAGVGTNDTARTIRLARGARERGADGSLVITPYYNRPGQAGLYAHCHAVADAVPDLPVILYNVPKRTGVSFTIDTIARLAEHPNIVGIKDATANMAFAAQIVGRSSADFALLSGDDITALPQWSVGAQGIVSVTSNLVPEDMVALWRAFDEGRLPEAQRLHHRLLPLFDGLFLETNPVPIKHLVAWTTGDCSAEVRLPLTPLTAESADALRRMCAMLEIEPAP
ncbi:MAG: 4-hydroxy-tetrahydrodipicolinate synthase [Myxococcota bacterium]|nr:4-hydroxy-tetrahydrodipicolinate synthase [Myxococcota bacterium]